MSKSGHQRQSLRLPGYDYAQAGAYFVTICTQGRRCWFGTVINGQMQLSPAGKMLQGWLEKIPTKFPGYCLDVSVIMPNHVHFIVVIDRPTLGITQTAVGTDPCVCPDDCPGEHMGSPLRIPLSRMVQWFKTMTTNHYIRGVRTGICPAFDQRLWQRSFYEHIIRDEQSWENLRHYIATNPRRWAEDRFFAASDC